MHLELGLRETGRLKGRYTVRMGLAPEAARPWLRVLQLFARPAERTNVFLNDLRYALRSWLREPGFALAAILTLALGVG